MRSLHTLVVGPLPPILVESDSVEVIVLPNKEANGLTEINNLANDIEDVVRNMGEVSPSPSAPVYVMMLSTASLELW